MILRLVLATLVSFRVAIALQSHYVNVERVLSYSERVVSTLSNFGDVQYTCNITVGGQNLSAVVDTGSFDIIVFSAQCNDACGPMNLLFDEKKSNTFRAGDLWTKQAFGSGTTESQTSWDTVKVANDVGAKDQFFWKAYNSDMWITREGSFQAIMGVGPPASAVVMAQWALKKAQEKESENSITSFLDQATGGIVSSFVKSYLIRLAPWSHRSFSAFPLFEDIGPDSKSYYSELVNHAKREKSFLERAGVRTMSICLRKESGSDGIYVWNDHDPKSYPEGTFHVVKNVGDIYWSAGLQNARIGDRVIGCQDGEACSGVIDTGTSLLSVPASISRYVETLVEGLETCDDMFSLPDLEFTLGGALLSIPPESYVGYVDEVSGSGGGIQHRVKGDRCESLLMTTDSVGPNGQEWIIGLPLFRKYYTTFQFNENWQPEAMHFAEADGDCNPSGGRSRKWLSTFSRGVKNRKRNILRIDRNKVRGARGFLNVSSPRPRRNRSRSGSAKNILRVDETKLSAVRRFLARRSPRLPFRPGTAANVYQR